MYSNLGGGNQGHISLVPTGAQYALIYQTSFVCPNQPVPLTIPDKTTAAITTIMCDTNTEDLHVFCKVMGVEQAFIQWIFSDMDKAYLVDIRDRATNNVNMKVSDLITHLQYTYGNVYPKIF